MSLADELLADLEDDNDEDLEELKKEKDESDDNDDEPEDEKPEFEEKMDIDLKVDSVRDICKLRDSVRLNKILEDITHYVSKPIREFCFDGCYVRLYKKPPEEGQHMTRVMKRATRVGVFMLGEPEPKRSHTETEVFRGLVNEDGMSVDVDLEPSTFVAPHDQTAVNLQFEGTAESECLNGSDNNTLVLEGVSYDDNVPITKNRPFQNFGRKRLQELKLLIEEEIKFLDDPKEDFGKLPLGLRASDHI